MKNKNKYIIRSKISEAKFREIVKYFSLDIEANKAAVLASLNRNTLNRYYFLIRKRIAEYCQNQGFLMGIDNFNNLSADLSLLEEGDLFANNGSMIFGICLVNGRIYTEIIMDRQMLDTKSVLSSKEVLECYISTCENLRWRDYCAVVDYDCGRYIRLGIGINGYEAGLDVKSCDLFWGYAKTRLMKFNGVSKNTLFYHIKECEFRFNHRTENIYKMLLKIIRKNPIN